MCAVEGESAIPTFATISSSLALCGWHANFAGRCAAKLAMHVRRAAARLARRQVLDYAATCDRRD